MTTQTTELSLTGRVHSALRSLPGTTLTLTDRAGGQVGRAHTGPAGEFLVTGLAPGSYVVIFSRAGYEPHARVVMPGEPPLDVVLEPAVSVHGVVHDRDSGQPVGAATVTAVGPGGEVAASTVSAPTATTASPASTRTPSPWSWPPRAPTPARPWSTSAAAPTSR